MVMVHTLRGRAVVLAVLVAALCVPATVQASAADTSVGSRYVPPAPSAKPATSAKPSKPAGGASNPVPATASPACTSSWGIIPSPNSYANNELNSVAAISPTDIWAVGDNNANTTAGQTQDVRVTQAQHWDGSAWSIVTTPDTNAGTGSNVLTSVSATSSTDAWAVGLSQPDPNSPRSTLTEHWNGSLWTIVTSPNSAGSNSLFSVKGDSANDYWAVGEAHSATSDQVLVEHWNGSAWTISQAINPSTHAILIAVKVLSPTNVWAVGEQSTDNVTFTTLIEHWNGTAWSVVPSVQSGNGNNVLLGVDGTASDLWAVGASQLNGSDITLIEHWNGSNWSAVSNPPTGVSTDLLSIAAVSSTDVWAVGSTAPTTTTAQPFVVHWDGTSWSSIAAANSGSISGFNDVAAIGTDVWSVGSYVNTGNTAQTLTENYCKPPPPTVTSINPTSGPTAGGTSVTVTGTGFNGATGVQFGASPATNFTVNSDTQLTAVSPAGAQGTTDVRVSYSGGLSPLSVGDQFFYIAPPAPPIQIQALPGDTEATITWKPSGSNGGSAITSYIVIATPSGRTVTVSAVTPAATITGLTNGTPYTFTVAAINAGGTGPNSVGSAPVTPAAVVQGGAVAVLPTVTSGAYGGYLTVAYLENFNPLAAHIRVQYFDQNGNPVGVGNSAAGLPFWGTWTLRQDNADALAAGQAGSAVVYSDQPLAIFVNEFAPNNAGDATSYSSVKLPAGAAATVYAPAIANNAYGGYTTGIGLINAGTAATDVRITYRDGSGTTVRTQNLTAVAANAYQGLFSGDATLALPAGFAGTATIESTSLPAQPLAAVVNEVGPGGQFSSYDAVPAGTATVAAPVALNNAFGGYFTGMGIQNTGTTAGTVTITYYDGSGTLVKTVSNQAIPASGYLGVYQGDPTLGPPPSASGYTAVLSSTVLIAAIVNEVAPSSTSAQQSTAYNTFASGSTALNLPLVESDGTDGWSTGEGIMNMGLTATTVTVTYFDPATGAPVGTPQSLLLQPNAFWGLYQPAGGLPTGTRASAQVTTTGQPVAVICNESNATTFMSYSGQ